MRVTKEVFSLTSGKALIIQEDDNSDDVCFAVAGPKGGMQATVWLPRSETLELGRALVRLYEGES